MDRALEDGSGKALAQIRAAQNQGDAYGDSNSFGSGLLRRIIDAIPALAVRGGTPRISGAAVSNQAMTL